MTHEILLMTRLVPIQKKKKKLQHLHKNTNRYNTETNDHEHEPLVKNIDAIR